jgi:pilus assembly protein CpaE
MRPDVAIPDLPKVVGQAASIGEAAVTMRGGFRDGMLRLAREVAFVRLLDGDTAASAPSKAASGRLRRLFGLKS